MVLPARRVAPVALSKPVTSAFFSNSVASKPSDVTRDVTPPPLLAESTEPPPHHWVYGTARQQIVSDADESVVANTGDRVLLVYPMKDSPVKGTVSMRVKTAHPVTAQLAYTWVTVYDSNTDERFFCDFSTVV